MFMTHHIYILTICHIFKNLLDSCRKSMINKKRLVIFYDDGDICWDYYKVPYKVKKNVYMNMCYSKFKGKIVIDINTYKDY